MSLIDLGDAVLQRIARRPVLPQPVPTAFYPGAEQWGPSPLPNVSSGVLLGLPAAWRCVNLVANGVALMSPLEAFKPDGYTKLDDKPIFCRPDPSMETFDYWHMAVSTALVRGNFFGIKADYDAAGFPQQVIAVHPNLCQVNINGKGFFVYTINGREYEADEIVHVRGFTLPNTPRGLGVIENFRRMIGQQADQQNLAASTYREGSVPTGILKFDKPVIDKEVASNVKDQWVANHGAGQRAPAVLPSTMTFEPLTFTPEDTQFLQSRQFSVAEMTFAFNLDPSDLGAAVGGQSMTYQNIAQRQAARQSDTYGPWMRRFEEAWSDLIPGGNSVRFNPDNGLRLDAETRSKIHETNIATGLETVKEARVADGKAPSAPPELADPPPPVASVDPNNPSAPPKPTEIPGTHLSVGPDKVKI